MGLRVSAAAVATAIAAASLACSDAVQPESAAPELEIVRIPKPDTIGAPATDSLVVVVRSGGVPAAGVVVRFTRDAASPLLHFPAGGRDFDALEVTTDASGRAGVLVGRPPLNAGVAMLRIAVPSLSLYGNAPVTVLPGAPVTITSLSNPVVTVVTGQRSIAPALLDRNHQLTTGPLSCRTVLGVAELRDACTVAGLRYGTDTLIVTSGALSARAQIHVVPLGRVASDGQFMQSWTGAMLDGSGSIAMANAQSPKWLPGGDSLIITRPDSAARTRFWVVDQRGSGRLLMPALAGSTAEFGHAPSADGRWVYFTSVRSGISEIWRVRRDGSEPALLVRADAERSVYAPSPSPDGRFVAFRDSRGWAGEIRILDLATGEIRGLGPQTLAWAGPAWSPRGDWIAFVDVSTAVPALYGGAIRLIRPDGSELRTVRKAGVNRDGAEDLTWSPDGDYILFSMPSPYRPGPHRVIEVATGIELMTGTGGYSLSWTR